MNETRHRPILVVEDSDDDYDTVERAAARGCVLNRLVRAVDGDSAEARLRESGARHFAFVLLDFNLPGRDGLSLLREWRKTESLSRLPVVVYTTSVNSRDLDAFYRAGANACHVKTVDFEACLCALEGIFDYWLKRTTLPTSIGNGVPWEKLIDHG